VTTRIGINGFGRIGRNVFRALSQHPADLQVVAINDLMSADMLAHLLRYDSGHGALPVEVSDTQSALQIGDSRIEITAHRNPQNISWDAMGVDIVLEATGRFTSAADAGEHLKSGAKKVIVTAPCDDADITIAMGANHQAYNSSEHHIISNASCTTNCLAPLAGVLDAEFGIQNGLMTTIHAYTADQNLQDGPHQDLRRARAAALNIIPTSTGAARAIGHVLPRLAGKLEGVAMRVPVPVGSVTDLTVTLSRSATIDGVNAAFQAASNSVQWNGILSYTEEPIVSSDSIGEAFSCIFDAGLTQVVGDQVKVMGWYDNEWGYSNRLVELTAMVSQQLHGMQLA